MRKFGKQPKAKEAPKETVIVSRIELDDETRQALIGLHNDIDVLESLLQEVSDKASRILSRLHHTATLGEPEEDDVEVGVRVFDGERPQLPDGMVTAQEFEDTVGADRVRMSPFTRSPRHTQVEWLKGVMADGGWYAPVVVAREFANDERHFRYLRSALQARLREMHEEGIVERRDSRTKGSMFEYRLAGQRTP